MEYALILVLVAIVVIVVLAVIGPQVGNVFSQVITVLGGNPGDPLVSLSVARTGNEGNDVTVTVTVSSGVTVTLTSSDPAILSVPASVLIPAGGSSARFDVTAFSITDPTSVLVTASWAGTQRSDGIQVWFGPLYRIESIGSLATGPTHATGINEQGEVSGESQDGAFFQRLVRQRSGQELEDLGNGFGTAINDVTS